MAGQDPGEVMRQFVRRHPIAVALAGAAAVAVVAVAVVAVAGLGTAGGDDERMVVAGHGVGSAGMLPGQIDRQDEDGDQLGTLTATPVRRRATETPTPTETVEPTETPEPTETAAPPPPPPPPPATATPFGGAAGGGIAPPETGTGGYLP